MANRLELKAIECRVGCGACCIAAEAAGCAGCAPDRAATMASASACAALASPGSPREPFGRSRAEGSLPPALMGLAMLAYILWGEKFGGSAEKAQGFVNRTRGWADHARPRLTATIRISRATSTASQRLRRGAAAGTRGSLAAGGRGACVTSFTVRSIVCRPPPPQRWDGLRARARSPGCARSARCAGGCRSPWHPPTLHPGPGPGDW